jgi:hypothetical protein
MESRYIIKLLNFMNSKLKARFRYMYYYTVSSLDRGSFCDSFARLGNRQPVSERQGPELGHLLGSGHFPRAAAVGYPGWGCGIAAFLFSPPRTRSGAIDQWRA